MQQLRVQPAHGWCVAQFWTGPIGLACFASSASRLCQCADLADVVVRKEVDMEDYLQRYDLTPLVQTEKLDAGKRVLQRVCDPKHKLSALNVTFVPQQADVLGECG